jgi:ATP-binding cassette subfamily F protein 3
VFEPTLNFSGGERSRLALAILVARRPNLLLLDEPTNHLDLSLRHTLLLALQEFPGAVIVVSHDRALLRGACDRFALAANGALTPFEGDLEDYAAWLQANRATPDAPEDGGAAPSRREQRQAQAAARARLSPLRREQQQLEARLAALTREQLEVENALADPATYAQLALAQQRQLSQRHGALTGQIASTEERWLAVMTELEERAS